VARPAPASANRTTLGELAMGEGCVRILGGLLQFPTTELFHPFGLSSYALTDTGYTLTRNLWTWSNPAQSPRPDLRDDAIRWIESDTPNRYELLPARQFHHGGRP
jgi:hypothetical protein